MSSKYCLVTGFCLLLAACGGGGGGGGNSATVPRPTVSLSAAPNSVQKGGISTLTWNSTDATSCSATGGWTGTLAGSGTQSTAPITVATTFSLTCTGTGGSSDAATTTVSVIPAPAATLSASPTSVPAGGTSTLTWTSTDATACTASGGWTGPLEPSGSRITAALTATTTYSITCAGAGGSSAAAAVTVNVTFTPTVVLSASPNSVAAGGTSSLTWTSTNATACTASGGWGGALGPSGTRSTSAITSPTTYSISCIGAGGTSSVAAATVNVIPKATLTASPGAVAGGGASMLAWTSSNATGCTASGSWSGAKSTSGAQSTGAISVPSAYSLTCTGPGGMSTPSSVTVNVIPTATLAAYPTVVASGGASSLTWSSSNATGCTASGGWSGAKAASGTQSTGTLSATTSYSLTCSGPGGTSTVSTATVTIANGSVSVVPRVAALTEWQPQQFAATVPGGGTATWSVDGIAGGNGTVGTISAGGLYTPGTAVGTHTVVATSVANTSESGSAAVAITDLAGMYTYHNDAARDGANTREYALTTANVNTAQFGKLFSCATDGAIYGQPLWVANVTVNAAQHNLVLVATEHDSLFAFDADASPCATLWSVSLIDAGHGGSSTETTVPAGPTGNLVGVGYGDTQPEVGVTGTSVIDPATNTLYVVSKSVDAAQTTFYQRLHAIDLTSGKERVGSPVTIGGTYPGTGDGGTTVTFNARQQHQRAGLALVNGVIYIAWAAHEDRSPYYGWAMGYRYDGTSFAQTGVLNVTPDAQYGGIWMGGGAMAADSANNLYLLTGNGTFDATTTTPPNTDYGDSLLQISPSLTISQYFTPTDQLADQQGDRDFGSGGAAVLADLPAGSPVTHLVLGGGKDGGLYVLDRDNLGGLGDAAAVQLLPLGHGIFSTGAFWNNSFYIAGAGGPLSAYALNAAQAQFALSSATSAIYSWPGGTPSVSASGAQAGIVWILNTHSYCTTQSSSCGPAVLHAYDATDLGSELWNSGLTSGDAAGNAVKFAVPTVANGKVYVGTRGNNTGGAYGSTTVSGELNVYGLRP